MTTETETGIITMTPATKELESPSIILSSKISAVVADCMTIKVADDSSANLANDALIRVRTFLKAIEEQRKAHLQPLNNYVKDVNSRFASLKLPIESVESHLLNEIQVYRNAINAAARREQERQNRLAEKRADRAEAKGVERPIPEVVAPIVQGAPKKLETIAGNVSYRKDWKADVVNPDLVPREYLMIDTVKINRVVQASKGSIPIPGVRIYCVEVPVTRMR